MSNIEQYLSKVDYYIEQAHKLKDETRREALLKASRDVLDMLDKMAENDIDAKTAITDRLVKIDSVKTPNKRFTGVKHFMANHKKLAAFATAGLILTGSLVGCTSMQNTKEDVAIVETNDKLTDYDTDRYSRNPLTGETLVQEGIAFAEELAKNGAYEKDGYGSEMYSLIGILNTTGPMPNKDEFAKTLALGEFYTDRGSFYTSINGMDEAIGKVISAKGTIQWDRIIPHKKSADLLNKAQKLYNQLKDGTPSKAQKDEWNKLVDEVIQDLEQYNAFSIMMFSPYMSRAQNSGLVTLEQLKLFQTSLSECGLTKLDDKNKDKDVEAIDTIYSTRKMLVVPDYLLDITKYKTSVEYKEGDIYYSFKEINKRVSTKLKEVKNANIDIEKKAEEQEIKNTTSKANQKYPGKQVDKSDPHINHATGNYESGNHRGGNTKGDVVDIPDKDANGNPTEDLKDDAYYSDLAAQHFNKGQQKDETLYNTQPAYKATWDAMKKAFDEASVPPPTDDPINVEEDEKENYHPQDPVTPPADQGTSNENEGETVTPPAPGDIVDVDEDEDVIMDDDFVLGDDGNWYPAGQLPEGVNPASFEEETISKTR